MVQHDFSSAGASWILLGTKPVTSNGAKCAHTIIQELLYVTKDSELVLESLKALLMWSFLLYIVSSLLQFERNTSILQ